jgi:hypothetical protein
MWGYSHSEGSLAEDVLWKETTDYMYVLHPEYLFFRAQKQRTSLYFWINSAMKKASKLELMGFSACLPYSWRKGRWGGLFRTKRSVCFLRTNRNMYTTRQLFKPCIFASAIMFLHVVPTPCYI